MGAASVIPIRRKRRPVGGVKACVGPCGRTLPLEDFHRRGGAADGRQSRCKACDALRSSKEHTAARAPRISRGQVERDAKPSTVVEAPLGSRPAELDDASKRLLMRVRRVYSRRLYERGLMVAPKRFTDDEDEVEPEAPVDDRGNAEDDDPTRAKGRGSSWTVDDQAEVEAWAAELALKLRAGECLRAALGLPVGRALSDEELERMGIRNEDSFAEGGVDTAGAAPPAPVSASPSPNERNEGGTKMSRAPAGFRTMKVLEALRVHGALKAVELAQHTGIKAEQVPGVLHRMKAKGLVAPLGDGRWNEVGAVDVPVARKQPSHTGGGGATSKRATAPKAAAPRAAEPSDDPLVADLRARLAVLDRRRQKIVDLLEDLGATA